MEIENQSVDYHPLILVAEDDDSNFKLIKAIIGKKCEVQWARNGEEIVSLFLENRDKADAILMDIKMPVMNGLDATQRIRREGGTLPIIMQTAYAFSSDRENAMNAGASEVLVKPITLSTLRNCLSSYLPNWCGRTPPALHHLPARVNSCRDSFFFRPDTKLHSPAKILRKIRKSSWRI